MPTVLCAERIAERPLQSLILDIWRELLFCRFPRGVRQYARRSRGPVGEPPPSDLRSPQADGGRQGDARPCSSAIGGARRRLGPRPQARLPAPPASWCAGEPGLYDRSPPGRGAACASARPYPKISACSFLIAPIWRPSIGRNAHCFREVTRRLSRRAIHPRSPSGMAPDARNGIAAPSLCVQCKI
jgi:hypothetical protein